MELYRRFTDPGNEPKNDKLVMPEKHGSYGALLFDRRWKEKRSLILIRDNNKCVICGFGEDLQIHHRQYHYETTLNKFRPPWEYSDRILITLCNSCHQRGHSKFKVPIIYI